ncbi:MAG: nucleotide-binding protein [Actinomycetota bacterium]|nr:nucleotide-binding protein [Actinomycetota bacterium]
MTIDARLIERLESKLGVGRRQIYNRINERSRTLVLPPEQAAIALALEHRVSVRGIATNDDMAAIRTAAASKAPAPVETPKATRKRPRKRQAPPKKAAVTRGKGKTVFVVHGRDVELRKSMFAFLRALGLTPIEFNKAVNKAVKEGGGGSPFVSNIVHQGLRDADAVVVLLSPDDVARLRKEFQKRTDPPYESRLTGQARPNVLFEAGVALGVKPRATVLVQVGDVRPFSDVSGMHVVHLHDGAEARQELAGRLEAIGLDVDTEGTEWYGTGRFSPT